MPFLADSKVLDATNLPTMHLSCNTRQKRLLHCESVSHGCHVSTTFAGVSTTMMIPVDANVLKEIKCHIHRQLIEKFILHPIHFAGAFLDPQQKFRLASVGVSNNGIVAGIPMPRRT